MRRFRAHGALGLKFLDQENGTSPRMGVGTLEPGPYRQHLQAGALCLPFELAAAHLCPALMQTGGVPCGRRVLPHVQPRLPCEAGLQ